MSSTDSGTLAENVRIKLQGEINDNDQSNAQVKAVCFILKDALKQSKDSMHDYLQEMLPVEVLFNEDCFTNHRIFSVVREFLTALNVPMLPDRNKRISFKVAKALYTDPMSSDEAVESVLAWLQLKRITAPASSTEAIMHRNTSQNTGHGYERSSLSRNKATVMSTFKEEEKFSGSVSGKVPLHRVKNKFLDVIRDQVIPRQEEVSLLHCCLTGMALDFYYKSIRGICTSTDQALLALERQFNSLQHQAQARTYLGNLTISGIVKEKECSTLEALELAHNRINDTVPSCGKEYQQPSHYCDFLQRIVEDEPWARMVIQARLTPGPNDAMDYNTFYSKLCAAVTVEESNKLDTVGTANQSATAASVFYGEQYAVPNRPLGRMQTGNRTRRYSRGGTGKLDISSMIRTPNRIKGRMSASQLSQLKARTRCLRCRQYGHWRHECPSKEASSMKDVMLSMVRKFGNDEHAVAETLWCIAEDDDEWLAYMTISQEHINTDESDPPTAFEALVHNANIEKYDDDDACKDLEACFDDIAAEFVGHCNAEDLQTERAPHFPVLMRQ